MIYYKKNNLCRNPIISQLQPSSAPYYDPSHTILRFRTQISPYTRVLNYARKSLYEMVTQSALRTSEGSISKKNHICDCFLSLKKCL